MGKKINGVVLAVTGAILVVGTAGAAPVTGAAVELPAGKKVMTADATTQPKVNKGAAATNVRVNAGPGKAVSGSSAAEVKVKKGSTPSTPTKMELGSKNPTVKQGSTPGGQAGTALAGKEQPKATTPKVKPGAASGGAVAQEIVRR